MQRAKTVTDEIRQAISSRKFDIIAAQEPYSYRNAVPGFGTVSKIIFDTKKFTGLAASGNIKAAIIVANPTYTVTTLGHLSNTHFACAEVITATHKLYVISAYFQCSDPIEPYLKHLEYVLHELKGRKIIICIDANAKSSLWHSNQTDDRGEALEELIVHNRLYILNRPSPHYTYDNTRGKSNIDVTLATSTAFGDIAEWEIQTDNTTSDHNTIKITIDSLTSDNHKPIITRYNIKRANWNKFEETLQTEMNNLDTPTDSHGEIEVETLAGKITKAIHAASDIAIPKKTRFNKSVPWWNSHISSLRKAVQQTR
ncbi:Retrovirus-related Pol polyprotein from type-1 retrotransposable element R1 (Fragment) [Anthophora quadrimaculata]